MKSVCLGELMLKLEPAGYTRFVQADSFSLTFGGAEANVAVSLSSFGLESYYVSKIPEHDIGQCAVNYLRRFGVKTDYVLRGGNRIGIYFNEKGASQRGGKCIYDRAGSAVQLSESKEYAWPEILKNASSFHLTGITPSLGENLLETCLDACKTAKENGALVTFDLNYRSKLWEPEQAKIALEKIFKYVDVCISNEDDLAKVFGIKIDKTNTEKGELNLDEYKKAARTFQEKYGFKKVALTLRSSINANQNGFQALLYNGNDFYLSRKYDMFIVDRVGGGDAFAAGLIYGFLSNKIDSEALEFAVAAGVLKHSIEGDFNQVSVEEVEKLAAGYAGGRIQR